MVIYRGNIQRLHEEVNATNSKARFAYRKVLGKKRADRFFEEAERLLTPESFVVSEKAFIFEGTLPRVNSFAPVASVSDNFFIPTDGKIEPTDILTAPTFHITEAGLENSNTKPPYIGSYYHEMNHFCNYVLSDKSLMVVQSLIAGDLGIMRVDFSNYQQLVMKIAEGVTSANRPEKIRKLRMLTNLLVLRNAEELATRVLDYLIFKEMGYSVEKPEWRGEEKGVAIVNVDSMALKLVLPIGGDPFGSLSDIEIVNRNQNWTKGVSLTDPLAANILNSYKNCRVRMVTFNELSTTED